MVKDQEDVEEDGDEVVWEVVDENMTEEQDRTDISGLSIFWRA